jgi:hypothetical protein
MPDPVISVDNLRNYNTLAGYCLTRNPQGLLDEIILNSQHIIKVTREDGKEHWVWEFGEGPLTETILHEDIHLKQQNYGEYPIKLDNIYHNLEFVQWANQVGIWPELGDGHHTKQATEPLLSFMERHLIEYKMIEELPSDLKGDWFRWWLDKMGKGRKGRSSLHNWVCPECHLHARMGIKGNPEIIHHPCSEKKGEKVFFVRAETIAQGMLGMKKD